ncbi:unnamed protein product [Didymodactylos carnosus]|uniref:PIPK domain-containing protein n=1 Tax=Didymodactylos carnosus TaxID=1234261 RepID=A0A814EE20_9BILA|nr:unnamed protein product [Didymodactylos carnosus]CAF0966727.1 unnamed protein product [Didymodactylos carnosus]CAF3697878.1 unnamed protein product [Didymodactylos carnosus]CAF3740230.1 unnamed protein product [Didymodactylos carnosus]
MSDIKVCDISQTDILQTLNRINFDSWNSTDSNVLSYLKSPIQHAAFAANSDTIGKTLRQSIIHFLDTIDIDRKNVLKDDEFRSTRTKHYEILEQSNNNNNNKTTIEITNLAPLAFEQLREKIHISRQDFRSSFADGDLINFANTGKSGSQMYKTYDDVYILKTLRNHEAKYLIQILRGLYSRYTQLSTLMTRYIGCYSIRIGALFTTEIYIVIMVNNLPSVVDVHEVYDLKGSTMGRLSSIDLPEKRLKALKDLDFEAYYPHGIRIPTEIYHSLRRVLQSDGEELRKLNITDYSLMLGIHHIDYEYKDNHIRRPELGLSTLFLATQFATLNKHTSPKTPPSPTVLTTLVTGTTNGIKTLKLKEKKSDSLKMEKFLMKPLKLIHLPKAQTFDDILIAKQLLAIPGVTEKGHRVLLYMVFIDILQTYDNFKYFQYMFQNLRDREHANQYSVISPDQYEQRLFEFLFEHVFIDSGLTLNELLKSKDKGQYFKHHHHHNRPHITLPKITRSHSYHANVNDNNQNQNEQDKTSKRKSANISLNEQNNGLSLSISLDKNDMNNRRRSSAFEIITLPPQPVETTTTTITTTTVEVKSIIQEYTIVNPLFSEIENKSPNVLHELVQLSSIPSTPSTPSSSKTLNQLIIPSIHCDQNENENENEKRTFL